MTKLVNQMRKIILLLIAVNLGIGFGQRATAPLPSANPPSEIRHPQSKDPPSALLEVATFASGAPPIPERLKIVSYNLHGPPGDKIDELINVLSTHSALAGTHIFALQEANRHHRFTAHKNIPVELAKALKMHYAYAIEHPYSAASGGGERCLAILSVFPLSQAERIALPHQGPKKWRRICLTAEVQVGPERVRVYTTHLETRISLAQRADQVRTILEHIKKQPPDTKIIVLGDFNTITEKARKLVFGLFDQAGFTPIFLGDKYTFRRSYFLRLKLDWAFARNLKAVAHGIETEIHTSDHRPLWIELGLGSGEAR